MYLLGLVLLILGIFLLMYSYQRYTNLTAFGIGVTSIVLGILFMLITLVNNIEFYDWMAQAKALRQVSSSVNLQASEDIAGKVADFNMLVASNQWYNNQWWAAGFIPDGWDTVTVIQVKQ